MHLFQFNPIFCVLVLVSHVILSGNAAAVDLLTSRSPLSSDEALRAAVARFRLLPSGAFTEDVLACEEEIARRLCECGRFGEAFDLFLRWKTPLSNLSPSLKWTLDCSSALSIPSCSSAETAWGGFGLSSKRLASRGVPLSSDRRCDGGDAEGKVFEKTASGLPAVREFLALFRLRESSVGPFPLRLEALRVSLEGERGPPPKMEAEWTAETFREDDPTFLRLLRETVEEAVAFGELDSIEKEAERDGGPSSREDVARLLSLAGLSESAREAAAVPPKWHCRKERLFWSFQTELLAVEGTLQTFFLPAVRQTLEKVWAGGVGPIPPRPPAFSEALPPKVAAVVVVRLRRLLSSALLAFSRLLSRAREAGIEHRDVIPRNLVFVAEKGKLRLQDRIALCLQRGEECSVQTEDVRLLDWDHSRLLPPQLLSSAPTSPDSLSSSAFERYSLEDRSLLELVNGLSSRVRSSLGEAWRDPTGEFDDFFSLGRCFQTSLTEEAANEGGVVFSFRTLLRKALAMMTFPTAHSRFPKKSQANSQVLPSKWDDALRVFEKEFIESAEKEETTDFLTIVYPAFFEVEAAAKGKPAICSAPNLKVHARPSITPETDSFGQRRPRPPLSTPPAAASHRRTIASRAVFGPISIAFRGYQNFRIWEKWTSEVVAVEVDQRDESLRRKEESLRLAEERAAAFGVSLFGNATVADIGGNHGKH